MSAMLIISDASPLICFIKINRLAILQQLFEKVIIPPIVYEEIQKIKPLGFSIDEFRQANWISILEPSNSVLFHDLSEKVDEGEAQAITLAKEVPPDFLLIDERRGTAIARSMGIKTIGVIGIVIRAKDKNLIPIGKPILDELMAKPKFWISDQVYQTALVLLGES
jgi:predicted nucleic acid-binding protein